jgi:toxin ParE1/3/4
VKRIVFHPAAKLELAEAREYHEVQVAGLGDRFLGAVDMAFREIQDNPKRCERYRRTTYRFWLVSDFPYVIYFRELRDRIRIVAIAHGSRRPGYWRRREID